MGLVTLLSDIKLSTKRHSPELLFIGGTAAMVCAIVSAFKARPKYEEIMEEHRKKVEEREAAIREADEFDEPYEKYPAVNRIVDKARDGFKTGMKTAVAFWKTIAWGALAVGCFWGGNRILRGWYVGAAAVAAGETRLRRATEAAIAAEYGKEKLQEVQDRVNSEYLVERGANPVGISEFARWFDNENENFRDGDPEANLKVLKWKLDVLNRLLHSRGKNGYLLGNEVWAEMGMPLTESGCIYGIRAYKPDGTANYLDFGIWRNDPAARRFVNGYEDTFLIQPNFDPEPIFQDIGFIKDLKRVQEKGEE